MTHEEKQKLNADCEAWMQRICKWRTVYTGRVLGTRPSADPQAKGYRDLFEKLILLRVEVSAITAVLIAKGLMEQTELQTAIISECEYMEQALRRSFPGFKSFVHGLEIDAFIARDTTSGWPP